MKVAPVLLGAVLLLGGTAPAASPAADDPAEHRVVVMRDSRIPESSALAVSTRAPGLVYTVNDSGNSPVVYAVSLRSGDVVGTAVLADVQTVDPEALAIGHDDRLYVADIGDNDATRSSVAIYRIVQPSTGDDRVAAETVQLTYADGPRDAESVLYDAASGRVFVVSKQAVGASIYATPARVFDRQRAVLQPLTAAPASATDATFLPGGHLAVVRTYVGAGIYSYPSWRLLRSVSLPPQPQGESVAAPSGGRVLWVGSEGLHSAVLAVRLPRLPTQSPTSQPGGPPPNPSASTSPGLTGGGTVAAGLSIAAVALIAGAVARFVKR